MSTPAPDRVLLNEAEPRVEPRLGEAASAQAEAALPRPIHPVHAIPGRVRIHVEGLRGAEGLRGRIETGLRLTPGVSRAQASIVTGNVLVQCERDVQIAFLLDRMHAILRGEVETDSADPPWSALDPALVASEQGSSPASGTSRKTARDRLACIGPNALPSKQGVRRLRSSGDSSTAFPLACWPLHRSYRSRQGPSRKPPPSWASSGSTGSSDI